MDKFGEIWENVFYRVNEKQKNLIKSVENDEFS